MITKHKEVKKPTISYQNYQALCDYLVYNRQLMLSEAYASKYNTGIKEYSKALNKLKIYFIVD